MTVIGGARDKVDSDLVLTILGFFLLGLHKSNDYKPGRRTKNNRLGESSGKVSAVGSKTWLQKANYTNCRSL
jgi:hypothetical protein